MNSPNESVCVQFTMNMIPVNHEHSAYDELQRIWPRPHVLTISENELTKPAHDSRNAVKHRKNPISFSPPRPLNAFLLYLKDFYAKLKSDGVILDNEANKKMSSIASKVWKQQPPSVHYYFTVLAKVAKEEHNKLYPGYKYKPRKPRNNGNKRVSKKANQFTPENKRVSKKENNNIEAELVFEIERSQNNLPLYERTSPVDIECDNITTPPKDVEFSYAESLASPESVNINDLNNDEWFDKYINYPLVSEFVL
ncbi:2501_t:CDS:1 [Scutellospora calospora]|uniref:2501_t:CDS:1 n=1 Tax=Scutellospora calospora TaxID=85575 RepID=A0ACA9LNT7_9GLOM|nr:2501_t:CDS:1 [Scutellospora calospora]